MNRTHTNACTGGEISIDFWHPKGKNVQASMRQIGVGQVVEWVGGGGGGGGAERQTLLAP